MQQCLRFLIREARAIDVACAWGTGMEKFSGAFGGRNHFCCQIVQRQFCFGADVYNFAVRLM